jgi:hypothetical protein
MTKRKISGQYVPHLRELIEAPAWRVLSLSARRLLDRIEIEHVRHGGQEKGQLAVTFDDFAKYGIIATLSPPLSGNVARSASWSSPEPAAPATPSIARQICSCCHTCRPTPPTRNGARSQRSKTPRPSPEKLPASAGLAAKTAAPKIKSQW